MSEWTDSLRDVLSEAIGHALPPVLLDAGIRAVLAAMEQPSQKMIDAARNTGYIDELIGSEELAPTEVWRAMITAELKPD